MQPAAIHPDTRALARPSIPVEHRYRLWRAQALVKAAVFFSVLLAWLGTARGAEGPAVYTVAVVPQFQPVEINRTWGPVLEYLGRATGQTFVLKLAKDIPAFEADLRAGAHDFAYMNPYHQVMAKRAQGYVPLVRDSKLLSGILVVRQDDPIQSVRALDGKTLSFPAPNAFGASLWIRAQLAEQERIKITPLYAKTHTNAYRQTLSGQTAAAGGVRATLDKEPEDVRNKLRVLMETPGAAPHPFSAHPRVSPKLQQAVIDAMLKMAADPAGLALLSEVLMPKPVRADYARDYWPIEQLKLDQYVE